MSAENKPIEQIKITEHISYIKASDNPLSADVILIEGQEYLYVYDVGNNEQVAEYINSLLKKKRVILSHFHSDHMGNIGRVEWETVYFGANTEKYFQHYIPDYAAKRFAELPGVFSAAFGLEQNAEHQSTEQQDRERKNREGQDTENVEMKTEEQQKKQKWVPKFVTVFEPIKIQDGVSIEIYHMPNSHAKGGLLLQVNEEYIFVGDSLYSKTDGDFYVYNAQLLKEEIELLKRLPGTKIFSSHEERPMKSKAGVIRFLEQIYAKRNKNDAYIKVARNK